MTILVIWPTERHLQSKLSISLKDWKHELNGNKLRIRLSVIVNSSESQRAWRLRLWCATWKRKEKSCVCSWNACMRRPKLILMCSCHHVLWRSNAWAKSKISSRCTVSTGTKTTGSRTRWRMKSSTPWKDRRASTYRCSSKTSLTGWSSWTRLSTQCGALTSSRKCTPWSKTWTMTKIWRCKRLTRQRPRIGEGAWQRRARSEEESCR